MLAEHIKTNSELAQN